jgi:hypothetical protein
MPSATDHAHDARGRHRRGPGDPAAGATPASTAAAPGATVAAGIGALCRTEEEDPRSAKRLRAAGAEQQR